MMIFFDSSGGKVCSLRRRACQHTVVLSTYRYRRYRTTNLFASAVNLDNYAAGRNESCRPRTLVPRPGIAGPGNVLEIHSIPHSSAIMFDGSTSKDSRKKQNSYTDF